MMKQIKEIIYLAGVVVNNVNRNKLKKFINSNMSNVYCHHMTVKYGNIDELPNFLGIEFTFRTDKVFFNKQAIAISGFVDDPYIKKIMKEANQKAHITICTADGVSPVYSNKLLEVGNNIEYTDTILLKFGAFVVFEDNNIGWVFDN